MSENKFIEELGALMRSGEQIEQPWQELCSGQLPASEVRALEREAEHDEQVARHLTAYRPLSVDWRERLVSVLEAEVSEEKAAPLEHETAVRLDVPVANDAPLSRAPAKVIWLLTPLVAAAAALILWLRAPLELTPLPHYQLEIAGAVSEQRGTASEGHVALTPASEVALTLRPAADVDGEVRARVFLVATSAELVPLEATTQVSTQGALRARVQLPARLPEAGELVVWVGRNSVVDENHMVDESTLLSGATEGNGWQLLRISFQRTETVSPQ